MKDMLFTYRVSPCSVLEYRVEVKEQDIRSKRTLAFPTSYKTKA